MKYPPILQILVAGALAWTLAEFLPLFEVKGWFINPIIWISALFGVGFLAIALVKFRKHETTFDPLNPSRAQTLVVSGIYRITRNPMYLGLLFLLIAWCLFVGDFIAFAIIPLFVVAMNELQIKGEESALLKKFGDDYISYKKRVRRWI